MTIVEIDPEILTVAKDYFELIEDERLTVVIADGLDYLRKAAEERKVYKSILFDVDSKDTLVGMSCPPVAFLTKEMLQTVKKCLVANGKSLFYCFNMRCNALIFNTLRI